MKKLIISVLMTLVLMAGSYYCGQQQERKKAEQQDIIAVSHIQLRNQIILELIDAETEQEKREVIKKYGITIRR